MVASLKVVLAQKLLSKLSPLRSDGLLGPRTLSVLASAPVSVRRLITTMIGVPLTMPQPLLHFSEVEMESADAIADGILQAHAIMDVPINWLVGFASIESSFNSDAVNGSSRGLYQFQEAAWNDASRLLAQQGVTLPPYRQGCFRARASALAAAAYIRLLEWRLSRMGVPVTIYNLYLAHQQGAAGLAAIYRAARGMYSRLNSRNMLRNPAPNTTPTANPKLFYSNWLRYLRTVFTDD
jgi:hypothetical protein